LIGVAVVTHSCDIIDLSGEEDDRAGSNPIVSGTMDGSNLAPSAIFVTFFATHPRLRMILKKSAIVLKVKLEAQVELNRSYP
jgi:hypothetical protein